MQLKTIYNDIIESFLTTQYDQSNGLGYLIIDSKRGGDAVYKMLFDGSSFHAVEEGPYHLLDNSPYVYDRGVTLQTVTHLYMLDTDGAASLILE